MKSPREWLVGRVLGFLLSCSVSCAALGAEIVGRVTGLADGDTITVLVDGHDMVKVRLAGIDAPEKAQPFGAASKKHLSDRVFGRTVTVEWMKRDKYGRVIGRVLLDGDDVCLEQVRAGLAWHYKAYAKEQAKTQRLAYSAAEEQARLDKVGLWSLPNQVPPWEFRHRGSDHMNKAPCSTTSGSTSARTGSHV